MQQSDVFLFEWAALARELASDTGLSAGMHLNDAYDLVTPLLHFAAIWDACAEAEKTEAIRFVDYWDAEADAGRRGIL